MGALLFRGPTTKNRRTFNYFLFVLLFLIILNWISMCVETCVEISDKSDKKWRSYSKHKLLGYLLIVFVHGGINTMLFIFIKLVNKYKISICSYYISELFVYFLMDYYIVIKVYWTLRKEGKNPIFLEGERVGHIIF